ncbi:GNAT family N-acetyltransferase [Floricoccus tropicus]|uniref:GNAT family N-acetyltransferase n=1 Tax=Floricoccus tropicus TaxID=1859473 RepID=A0A1E8GMN6_9LACT|nr:GNAT family N-acetyltransferase [Floricoccus tropicus]OFI49490.1 GNAT family N-acetyltransferase [Floricoccus tropicus]
MDIDTKRLKIIALTPSQLPKLVNNISKLERELDCSYQGQVIKGIFKKIILNQSLKVKEKDNDYLWLTFWLIIRKEDKVVVGTIDFKDIPNINEEVEIGYGLGESHKNHGYMTEAVEAFCAWGKQHKEVEYIISETESDNFPSQRVLQKCGFIEYYRDETIWWKL